MTAKKPDCLYGCVDGRVCREAEDHLGATEPCPHCRPAGKAPTPGALTREPHRAAEVYVDAQFLTLCANSEVCAESMTVDEIQFACRLALASLSRDEAAEKLADAVDAAWERGYSDGQYDTETHHTTHNPYQSPAPKPATGTDKEEK